MFNTLISLLSLILDSAIVPVQIIMVIPMLTAEKPGPAKAIAFISGMTLVRLAQGVIFGLIITGGATDDGGGSGWIKSTLLLVLGVFLLITAYRSFTNHPDPDAPPPKWLTMIGNASPLTALALGAGLVLIAAKLWVFTLGAIATIGNAQLGQPAGTITFVLFALLAASLLIIPTLIRLIFPTKAAALLGAFGDWLEKYNSQIVMVVSLIFGLLFLYKGITGLL